MPGSSAHTPRQPITPQAPGWAPKQSKGHRVQGHHGSRSVSSQEGALPPSGSGHDDEWRTADPCPRGQRAPACTHSQAAPGLRLETRRLACDAYVGQVPSYRWAPRAPSLKAEGGVALARATCIAGDPRETQASSPSTPEPDRVEYAPLMGPDAPGGETSSGPASAPGRWSSSLLKPLHTGHELALG